jgi:predicted Zn-dependent peptidase
MKNSISLPTSALMLLRNTGLSSHFATKDKDKVLTIIKEVLLNPVLTLPNLKKEKSRLLVRLEQQKESPQSVIGLL